ncbi:malonyl-CoA synthase, partial [Rhizobium ruizarguesonis]
MSNHLFDAMRAAAPVNAPFIRNDNTLTWTYDDAFALSGRIASSMDTLGIRPGDRVA